MSIQSFFGCNVSITAGKTPKRGVDQSASPTVDKMIDNFTSDGCDDPVPDYWYPSNITMSRLKTSDVLFFLPRNSKYRFHDTKDGMKSYEWVRDNIKTSDDLNKINNIVAGRYASFVTACYSKGRVNPLHPKLVTAHHGMLCLLYVLTSKSMMFRYC